MPAKQGFEQKANRKGMIGEAGEVKECNCASLKSHEVRPLPGMGNIEEGMVERNRG